MSELSQLGYETDSWRVSARCRDQDADIFFPDNAKFNLEAAKAICAQCAVKAECLEFALENYMNPNASAVWGGASQEERVLILSERQRGNE